MACREKEYAQALLDIDALAWVRGEKFGICDCVDRKGNPYPSSWLDGLLKDARENLKLIPSKNIDNLSDRWSTKNQW
jgi:hypothetical protein